MQLYPTPSFHLRDVGVVMLTMKVLYIFKLMVRFPSPTQKQVIL